ncbi:unnamed protein product [Darwinula stevensoni]|uniref:START domain-containing protein n=1 Tax=Darwinula stevensoni TaxID=69355 RepID=A0A7R8XIT3_9CRUS|nr:unnamed protein product [Darwinula stevensoni]CAG0894597.1 unnamed protein product [Darwinula stevensoni]
MLFLVVNVSAEVVFREDWDHVPDYPKWNPNFLHTEVVLDITSRCRLTYQVTTPIGNGLIWSRDAVTIAYWNKEGDATYLAFSSTSWPALPPSNRYVRCEPQLDLDTGLHNGRIRLLRSQSNLEP